ncbi:MAG: HAD family hydrolase, partial [Acidimicrobiales bacterium]
MGNTAAFFDLDRTVLRRASGPLISEALAAAGVVPSRGAGVGGVLYKIYDIVGETLPSMAMARAAALIARGWPADTVRQAGREVAEKLDGLVAPFARPLIKHHQDLGHRTVLATTTPLHLIEPFAAKMGFDDVIATRYAERDGAFTGALEG